MKKCVLVVCQEALIGVLSPISFLSEANLQKVVNLLEDGNCDFAYVVLELEQDGFDRRKVAEHLNNFFAKLDQRLQAKIIVVVSNRPYLKGFADYVSLIPGEVSVDVFARIGEKRSIKQALEKILDERWLNNQVASETVFLS